MRSLQRATDLLAGLVVTLLLTGGHALAAPPGQPPSALTTDEAIACIRTAVAAQAGLVKGVEGEDKQGKRLCEVKIVDETGKRHKLQVDVQTNQVVKAKEEAHGAGPVGRSWTSWRSAPVRDGLEKHPGKEPPWSKSAASWPETQRVEYPQQPNQGNAHYAPL